MGADIERSDSCGGGGGMWSLHTRVQRTSVSVSRTSTSTHTHALMNTHMCKACPPHTNACTHVCCRASERRAREHNIRVQRVWRARSHPLVQTSCVRTHVCNATHRARAALCKPTPPTPTPALVQCHPRRAHACAPPLSCCTPPPLTPPSSPPPRTSS